MAVKTTSLANHSVTPITLRVGLERASMPGDRRAQLRAVIKRVHPDLFAADPDARGVNAESLKVRRRTAASSPYPGLRFVTSFACQCRVTCSSRFMQTRCCPCRC